MQDKEFNGKVAFQGIEGAFSHQACHHMFPKASLLPCLSFIDAFHAVEQQQADYAVIPVENSRGGRVAEIHYILGETDLMIIGESFFAIKQHLLANKGVGLDAVRIVSSHPQALAQCHDYLHKMKFELFPHHDTAGAARAMKLSGAKDSAAIASSLAAEIYDLDILAENIQDQAHNTTRFLLFARSAQANHEAKANQSYLTSMIFSLISKPAALYNVLGCFANRQINLLKLESYIPLDHRGNARFYVEIEGHGEISNIKNAIQDMEEFTSKKRILGIYQADDWRKKG